MSGKGEKTIIWIENEEIVGVEKFKYVGTLSQIT